MTNEPARHIYTCCTPADAAAWVERLTEDALAGDRFSARLLPRAIQHWLSVSAQ